jgi:hypothetical protein
MHPHLLHMCPPISQSIKSRNPTSHQVWCYDFLLTKSSVLSDVERYLSDRRCWSKKFLPTPTPQTEIKNNHNPTPSLQTINWAIFLFLMINKDFSQPKNEQKFALPAVDQESYSTKTDRGRSSNMFLYIHTKGFGLEFDRVQSVRIILRPLLRVRSIIFDRFEIDPQKGSENYSDTLHPIELQEKPLDLVVVKQIRRSSTIRFCWITLLIDRWGRRHSPNIVSNISPKTIKKGLFVYRVIADSLNK